MPIVSRPTSPRRAVLTVAAKNALTNATLIGDRYYLRMIDVFDSVIESLEEYNLVEPDGVDNSSARLVRWALTDNGVRMVAYLRHQFHLRKLAEQIKAEGISGKDLADLAAGLDADEEAGTITGTSVDFQLAFELAAELSGQSAQDLRSDLEEYFGWGPRG